jgi:osmoprotectant transport system permease protein
MTDRQLLQMVELPLAAPTILAGVRIALVTNIGTAVIAAIIGGGGLGVLIFRGVESLDTLLILAGAVPAALMALLADGAMSYLEKKVALR